MLIQMHGGSITDLIGSREESKMDVPVARAIQMNTVVIVGISDDNNMIAVGYGERAHYRTPAAVPKDGG